MNLRDFQDDVSAKIARDVRKAYLRAELADRDDTLRYNVSNDRDDTGQRERVWASECVCSYCRRKGEMTPCGKHRLMQEELEEMES